MVIINMKAAVKVAMARQRNYLVYFHHFLTCRFVVFVLRKWWTNKNACRSIGRRGTRFQSRGKRRVERIDLHGNVINSERSSLC